ncbi:hypothetical protein [Rhodococcus sp. JVH1]|uniref:hypothetical protein n=1 Tax=Rhodococcus sp. JVH1 TaxID=745408 RepID=UPI0005C1A8D5|nr:hypothetical protein [Rhodococcus sp. JVH1]
MNSPGVVGIVVLQAMAAAAALAMLSYATWLIVAKMDLLTAAGPAVNTALVAVTPVSLAVGLVLGARLARRDPDLFARLGTTDVDAELSVPPDEVSNSPIQPGKAT